MKYFIEQISAHKNMTAQDLVKMCYQRAFGAKHMLGNIQNAAEYLKTEMEAVESEDIALFEEISPVYCRVNIAAWKFQNRSFEQLFSLFVKSAERHVDSCIQEQLEEAKKALVKSGRSDLIAEFDGYVSKYLEEGIRPVHHSKEYSETENPHYRVVRRDLL